MYFKIGNSNQTPVPSTSLSNVINLPIRQESNENRSAFLDSISNFDKKACLRIKNLFRKNKNEDKIPPLINKKKKDLR